jgi:hypothetical protein
MRFSIAALAALLLSSALPQTVYAQAPLPGQPHIQVSVPWVPGVGPQHREQWEHDRERREHCERLRHQEHEIRERLGLRDALW